MLVPIPVTDEQARAVTAAAELGKTVIHEAGELARSVGKVIGTAAEDAVGLTIGDPLRFWRTKQAIKYEQRITEIHRQRGVIETQGVSLTLALPLLSAAYDESRPELQEMWAALIAAAMDPLRADRVRVSFIETVKKLDPIDAIVLKERNVHAGGLEPYPLRFIAQRLMIAEDVLWVSAENLVQLRCCNTPNGVIQHFTVSPYGRELLRACSA